MPVDTIPALGRLRDRLRDLFGGRQLSALDRAVRSGDALGVFDLLRRLYLGSAVSAYDVHGEWLTLPRLDEVRLAEFTREAERWAAQMAQRAQAVPEMSPAWQDAYPEMAADQGLGQGYEYGARQAAVHSADKELGWKTWTRIYPVKKPRSWHDALNGKTIARTAKFVMPGGPNPGAECDGPYDWGGLDSAAEWIHCGHALVYTPEAEWADILERPIRRRAPRLPIPTPPAVPVAPAPAEGLRERESVDDARRRRLRQDIADNLGPNVLVSEFGPAGEPSAYLWSKEFDNAPDQVKAAYRQLATSMTFLNQEPDREGNVDLAWVRLDTREATMNLGQTMTLRSRVGHTGRPWVIDSIVHEAGHLVELVPVRGQQTALDIYVEYVYGVGGPIRGGATLQRPNYWNTVIPADRQRQVREGALYEYGKKNLHEDFVSAWSYAQFDMAALEKASPQRAKAMKEILAGLAKQGVK